MDKKTLTVAVIGGVHTGKTAVMQMIANKLNEIGFEVSLHNFPGEPLYNSQQLEQIEDVLPGKTRIDVIELAQNRRTDFISAAVGQELDHLGLRDTKVASGILVDSILAEKPEPDALPQMAYDKIVPVWAENRKQHFIDAPKRIQVQQNGHVVETLPFKFGAKFSLLGIAVTNELLASGAMDMTDHVSQHNAYVAELVFRVCNGQFISVPLAGPGKVSLKPTKDRYMAMAASFDGKTVVEIGPETLDIFGEPLIGAKPNKASIEFKVVGSINCETGTTEFQGHATVEAWRDPALDADVLPLSLEGYTLELKRDNFNRRPR